MSIQPNRVIKRIVQQVDASDWPRLESEVYPGEESGEWLRVYRAPADPRYATPLHFWAHALRDELSATECREDFIGAAGHALCHSRSISVWHAELKVIWSHPSFIGAEEYEPAKLETSGREPQVFRMLESECRRSSVLASGEAFFADFWGHGAGPSFRTRCRRGL